MLRVRSVFLSMQWFQLLGAVLPERERHFHSAVRFDLRQDGFPVSGIMHWFRSRSCFLWEDYDNSGKKFANPGPLKLTWNPVRFQIFANFRQVRDQGKQLIFRQARSNLLPRTALARLNHRQRGEWRELEGDLSKIVAIRIEPLHRLFESFSKRMLRLKVK